MVREAYGKVTVPIIGIGGIMDHNDALEFIVCGATAVQAGTANFINPTTAVEIADGIRRFLQDNKISDIKKVIGSLKN